MSAAEFVQVTLPGGVLDGDRRHGTATLRPLTGHEEELLATFGSDVPAAARVTALLGRCLGRLGPDEPTLDAVRRLTVGDREALLLHLRRLTLGDRIDCVVHCPQESCGEPVDVELRVPDLLLPPYDEVAVWREETVDAGDRAVRVRFRLPTGGDQEAVAPVAGTDVPAAARLLLRRCIGPVGEDPDAPDPPDEVVTVLAERMADLDPQAELRLDMTCPSCGAGIATLFDTATFLFAEVGAGHRLFEEVHALAWYYHWPEADILGLTSTRRRRYLDLIATSLRRGGERGAA